MTMRDKDNTPSCSNNKEPYFASDQLIRYAAIFLIGWGLPGALAILAGRSNLHYLMGMLLGCAVLMVLAGCVFMWFWIKHFNIEMHHHRSPYPSTYANQGGIPESWVPGHKYISAAKTKDSISLSKRN